MASHIEVISDKQKVDAVASKKNQGAMCNAHTCGSIMETPLSTLTKNHIIPMQIKCINGCIINCWMGDLRDTSGISPTGGDSLPRLCTVLHQMYRASSHMASYWLSKLLLRNTSFITFFILYTTHGDLKKYFTCMSQRMLPKLAKEKITLFH
uniref:Uncharacterized protein n=1 Tax=Pyxicephalus adspersus TaxID=30357 RepID=A0AAV3A0C6_PYXAD|nr:TPA: hypothetical protein GDO54_015192 [Pyxicephalus adspersus]